MALGTAAKIRETLIGFTKNKQAALQTALSSGSFISMKKLNAQMANPTLNIETDAAEIGKPNEFATQIFKTSWDVKGSMEKYLGADFAAWVIAFALGDVTESPSGTYTIIPLDTVADGLELPSFGYVEQIRPGASAVIDRHVIGCAIDDFAIAIGVGPSRANAKITANFVGCGKYAEPSTITLPSITDDVLLSAASLTCTINSMDYVTAKNLISLNATYKNNIRLDDGFYPGSGFLTSDPTSGAIRGRLEIGDREIGLQFTARFVHDSDELTKLYALTPGTASWSLTNSSSASLLFEYDNVAFKVAEVGETNGIVTVQVTVEPLYDTGASSILTVTAKAATTGIAQAAA
jgi:hypothetical protein